MFIVPGATPPYSEDAGKSFPSLESLSVTDNDIRKVYADFCTGSYDDFDIVHLGCPHASIEEMRMYADLVDGKTIKSGVEMWVTTSRTVIQMAREAGLLQSITKAGVKVIADTCPISCHFARTCSPDPELGVKPPTLQTIVVDSAKQARYVRDMIQCETLLTSTENAVASAITGRFVGRW